jgi:uncharacterized protein Usg
LLADFSIADNALILGTKFNFCACHGLESSENGAVHRMGIRMTTKGFPRRIEGYGLATAEILYRRPDHPWLLQTYIWQDYDLCPDFPELKGFLKFWETSLEGALHSVTIAHAKLIKPHEIRPVDGVFRLH